MLIDLSVVLNENTPVYPGDPKTIVKAAGVLGSDGFCDHIVSLGTHIGTHIDSPMHMLKDGKSLDRFPIDAFVGSGILIDVTNGFESILSANIQKSDIVILYTGMSKHYSEPIYFTKYTAMGTQIANYLVKKQIKMLGVDACSVDNKEGFPIHKILLENDILIIENLANLEKLVDQKFTIYALPLNLQLDGSPARVIAQTQ